MGTSFTQGGLYGDDIYGSDIPEEIRNIKGGSDYVLEYAKSWVIRQYVISRVHAGLMTENEACELRSRASTREGMYNVAASIMHSVADHDGNLAEVKVLTSEGRLNGIGMN